MSFPVAETEFISDLERQPENVLQEILLEFTDPRELIQVCRLSKKIRKVCNEYGTIRRHLSSLLPLSPYKRGSAKEGRGPMPEEEPVLMGEDLPLPITARLLQILTHPMTPNYDVEGTQDLLEDLHESFPWFADKRWQSRITWDPKMHPRIWAVTLRLMATLNLLEESAEGNDKTEAEAAELLLLGFRYHYPILYRIYTEYQKNIGFEEIPVELESVDQLQEYLQSDLVELGTLLTM